MRFSPIHSKNQDRERLSRRLAAVGVVFCLCALVWFLVRFCEPLWVIVDLASGQNPSPLKFLTEKPLRLPVFYTEGERTHFGDLYLPPKGPKAAIVLVPGAVPMSNSDPRLVALADTLARVGFAVLAPDMEGFQKLEIRPENIREVADALLWFSKQPQLAVGGRIGCGALSYAAGPALLASLEPDVRERVRFLILIGGYYDLQETIAYLASSHPSDEERITVDYGRGVFLQSCLAYLNDERDRHTLETLAKAWLFGHHANPSDFFGQVGPQGKALLSLLVDSTTPGCKGKDLPPRLVEDFKKLSPSSADLSLLKARVILVHGKRDPLIPYTQSLALLDHLPPGQSRLFLFDSLIGHVDLHPVSCFDPAFYTQELPDIWRLFEVVSSLLREREA